MLLNKKSEEINQDLKYIQDKISFLEQERNKKINLVNNQ
jgi:hypothetical protein